MGIEAYTKGLVKNNGIWYAEKKTAISYPDEGNDAFYQIEENSFWFRHRNNCIVELVKRFAPKDLFFDIGGGNGYVAKAIEKSGIETILVEPGERGCINARTRELKNIICSTLEDAGFEKETIPAIGVFDVVEHFKEDIALLKLLHAYLQKDGYLFITVPAHEILWSNEDDDAGHFNRYTIKSLTKKLNDVGFDVAYATYIFSVLPVPIFLMRSLPSRLGMHKNSGDINKHSNEHKSKGSVLDKVWDWELSRIKAKKEIPFGGSCLVVAKKNN